MLGLALGQRYDDGYEVVDHYGDENDDGPFSGKTRIRSTNTMMTAIVIMMMMMVITAMMRVVMMMLLFSKIVDDDNGNGNDDNTQCVNIGWCSPILALADFSPKTHCFQF